MKKTTMYHDIHRTKIYSGIYKPSFNLFSFIRSICSVLFIGQSPITTAGYAKRK